MIGALIPNWLKYLLTGIVAACIMAGGGYLLGKREGRQQAKTEQLQSDIKAERERVKDDAKLRSLSDFDFCVVSLRRRGMQSADCEQLRGVAAE
ncbi:hypothetical protein [Brucella pseudogrignonensis]|uniref:hypothetical protein n=1 Tax=Brucella pseudogrignonensis TaxID=419475 RepID=UPI000CFB5631|nr:hypothetical protein [Brucella pseudogrignonensis]MQP38660.1 hypothetical protein [Ochrobactrum sp. MYb237]PQZ43277.1 hypothetical protein CQ059_04910 [Brucella pseudogrignonensis]PRA43024.1 hypothetical protein CQ063_01395 [Brucella pseudogrignonensis]PRA72508.1 hypothetical protein CQ055_04185 [Brucella pseudogrignonensis]